MARCCDVHRSLNTLTVRFRNATFSVWDLCIRECVCGGGGGRRRQDVGKGRKVCARVMYLGLRRPTPPRPDCESPLSPEPPPHLPWRVFLLDLIPLVVEFVSLLPPREATRTLLSLSLVSAAWSESARAQLYRAPEISRPGKGPSIRKARLLLSTLQSNPARGVAVRSLSHLGTWTAYFAGPSPPSRRDVSRLAIDLVLACPRLVSLGFPWATLQDAPELEDALGRLREVEELWVGEGVAMADPWVIHLDPEVYAEIGSATWTYTQVREIVARWPRLRRRHFDALLRGGD